VSLRLVAEDGGDVHARRVDVVPFAVQAVVACTGQVRRRDARGATRGQRAFMLTRQAGAAIDAGWNRDPQFLAHCCTPWPPQFAQGLQSLAAASTGTGGHWVKAAEGGCGWRDATGGSCEVCQVLCAAGLGAEPESAAGFQVAISDVHAPGEPFVELMLRSRRRSVAWRGRGDGGRRLGPHEALRGFEQVASRHIALSGGPPPLTAGSRTWS